MPIVATAALATSYAVNDLQITAPMPILVGYDEHGKLRFAGKVRAGFVPNVRRELFKTLTLLHPDECPFVDLPGGSSRWGRGVTADEMKVRGTRSCRVQRHFGLVFGASAGFAVRLRCVRTVENENLKNVAAGVVPVRAVYMGDCKRPPGRRVAGSIRLLEGPA